MAPGATGTGGGPHGGVHGTATGGNGTGGAAAAGGAGAGGRMSHAAAGAVATEVLSVHRLHIDEVLENTRPREISIFRNMAYENQNTTLRLRRRCEKRCALSILCH